MYEKKNYIFFVSICLITLCFSQSVLAAESDRGKEGLDEIYAEAYSKAIAYIPDVVDSDEEAYAYLISHMDYVQKKSDGTIFVENQDIVLSGQEKDVVLSFVEKLNTLIQLDAISVDASLQLHFVSNPSDTKISVRRPVANIMGEARSHASELKKVFDNAVFATKHYTAGMYFAERVKTGGVWDYKSYMGSKTLYYMEDLRTNMTGETIGNFHYGYVGRAVFEPVTLRSAAGMYQIISGTSNLGYWDSFFDDPSDQHDINWGISKYESEH